MRVAIVSDVVCPWCRIGKANLVKAADQWTRETGEPVEISLLPFQLDPIEPGTRESFRERFTRRKGIPEAQMLSMFERVIEAGARQGIHFDFSKVEVAVDTVPAHELIELAPVNKRLTLMDALMTAYFEEGRDVGDANVLMSVAGQAGLTDEELVEIGPALRSRHMEAAVRSTIARIQQAGVTGVPFFIVNDVATVSGAQPPEVLLHAFREARDAEPVINL